MDVTPAILNALLTNKPLPAAAATVAAAGNSAADFHQLLAVMKPLDAAAAVAKAALVPVGNSGLSAACPTSADVAAGTPPMNVKLQGTIQSASAKHGKKMAGKNTRTGATGATSPPSSVTAFTAVTGAAMEKLAVPAPATAVTPPPVAPPAAAPEPVQPTAPAIGSPALAASVSAGAGKPDPAIISINAKPHPAAATLETAAATPAASSDIPLNASSAAASSPVAALHSSVKTADIIKQIAAALPPASQINAPANSALHVSLTPATLGVITLQISQHASGATAVTISASQPETLAALKHDGPNLNQILTNAGVPAADRQIDFKTIPVAATPTSTGLGSAGGQSADRHSADAQSADAQSGGAQFANGQFANGQAGQGTANGQQQEAGTAFANANARAKANASNSPIAPLAPGMVVRSRPNSGRGAIDVIA